MTERHACCSGRAFLVVIGRLVGYFLPRQKSFGVLTVSVFGKFFGLSPTVPCPVLSRFFSFLVSLFRFSELIQIDDIGAHDNPRLRRSF